MDSTLTPFISYAWLIPALPLLSFIVVGLFIRPYSTRLSAIVATLAVFGSLVCAVGVATEYIGSETHSAIIPWQFEWLRYQAHFTVRAGVLVDSLSVLLMLVVTLVSSLVHLYSIAYMHGEDGKGRFFTFLNFFTFSMLGLVVAPNILQTFVCWELVGASSFLLIGYYYKKPAAVAASKKAFIVTRFADLGFLIGAIILGSYAYESYIALPIAGLEPFDFAYLTSSNFLDGFKLLDSAIPGVSLVTLAGLLIFMGAAGKSAMFPLHVWLPDAMEGPTPVSALIHAATMVVAGVYLVARMFALFSASATVLIVIATVGTFTCLFAALIGCVQNDLKRVLAFSTLSQLGYMMLALGVASSADPLGYSASMFHLFTHAFFKALLFLCAGAAIHAVHTNNIWEMGGLKRKMPVTHLSFLIATLAIAGVYPLAGFFSKDEILLAALSSGHYIVFATALFVAGLTAFYMSRVYFVCFWGTAQSKNAEHAHEAPLLMQIPLVVLAFLSIVAGFIPVAELVKFGSGSHEVHATTLLIPIAGSCMALIGIFSAWYFYIKNTNLRDLLVSRMSFFYIALRQKFYIDEVYLFITHKIIFRYLAAPATWVDRYVVDGAVNASGYGTRLLGRGLSALQTGQLQSYGVWLMAGVILLFIWIA